MVPELNAFGLFARAAGGLLVRVCSILVVAEPATKDLLLKAVEELPDDVMLDEVIEKLCFLAKVEPGAEAGERRKHSPPRRSQRTLARVTKLRCMPQAVEDVEAIGKFIAHDSNAERSSCGSDLAMNYILA